MDWKFDSMWPPVSISPSCASTANLFDHTCAGTGVSAQSDLQLPGATPAPDSPGHRGQVAALPFPLASGYPDADHLEALGHRLWEWPPAQPF